ncbi:alanine racemase [Mesorhizobium sp. CAU 1732]|uniref:alanine racemase n=1 Tax=Mesorhizobium sp. CAU 1732 TaxID=3140358 RepID=UPI0032600721
MSGWIPLSVDATHGGADPRLAGGRLTIDLAALAENYHLLSRMAAPARVAGVVKADGYGLGVGPVAQTLWREGCREFFVALPEEGIALRSVLPDATIYVLNGLFGAEAVPAYVAHRLTPVLGSSSDIASWEAFGWDGDVPRPCAIHVDTGMNRLGLTSDEALRFIQENALTGAVTPLLLMSHLACADTPDHPLNLRQRESFQAVRAAFASVESSLANSAGIFLDSAFAFDLVRPGIALYGGSPASAALNPMQPVVTAEARVVQVRHAKAGETVSYGAHETLRRDSLLAVTSIGYADGYHRAGSSAGVPLRDTSAPAAEGFIHGKRVPVTGRITMDMTIFDVTDLGAGAVAIGDHIELFGRNVPIDEAAAATGTIAYELLTSLGRRYHRRYVGFSE